MKLADCVPEDDRFKFVDDLTILEIINLLNVGLSAYNFRNHVASDIPADGLYIDKNSFKTQNYIEKINDWSEDHKMVISKKKTKAMLFNFTQNYQFGTRLKLEDENIEIVNEMKLLGTVINSNLTWEDNCAYLIKKVNNRMILLRQILSFGATNAEMVHFFYCFLQEHIRAIMCCVS